MRLISWNCNGALRNKLHKVLPLDADICVIQECEDPAQSKSDDYKTWAGNYLWTGTNKNRGLGVFAKPNISLTAVPLDTEPLELFLPCTIDQSLSLLAVWTREARSPTFRYIGQLWKFLQKHPRFWLRIGQSCWAISTAMLAGTSGTVGGTTAMWSGS